jgi:hypothetical protein
VAYVKATVVEKDMGLKKILTEMVNTGTMPVTVGVHPEDDRRYAVNHPREGMIGNVQAAGMNEFGATIHGSDGQVIEIPPRAPFRKTLAANATVYPKIIANLINKVISSKGTFTAKDMFESIGRRMAADVREAILAGGKFPPALAPFTIYKRRAKGVSDTRVFYDSHQLYHAIKHKVEQK